MTPAGGARAATGRLIAIEGLDGVGKTSLARELGSLLAARMERTPLRQVKTARSVVDAAFSESPTARALFYAANVVALSDRVGPWLADGDDVVVDRYWLSTRAYATPSCLQALQHIEPFVRPADVTIFLHAREHRRSRRLRARGANADDLATLDPKIRRSITKAYARELQRLLAGTVVTLDTSDLSVHEVATLASCALRQTVVAC
ncbi:MAG: AAA family ATPase [Myxococcales bacterium]|nr:AAA family ATPase [Myxococcales bacterium]